MKKSKVVVICPGRGSYTRESIGFINKYGSDVKSKITQFDEYRKSKGYATISELDKMAFKSKIHMKGENAAPLIFSCSKLDFDQINKKKYEIIAITGNSMGWYTSLNLASSLNDKDAFHMIQNMGSMMKDELIGGQIIYPIINENWEIKKEYQQYLLNLMKTHNAYLSIDFGGYYVIGGKLKSLKLIIKELPKIDKYPLEVPYNGAFHTPLMNDISKKALKFSESLDFQKPDIPMVDGNGNIWTPFSTNLSLLKNYTLKEQVENSFNFSASIETCLKEFCPEKVILLGPGNSLGGSIAQIMININWLSIKSKNDFLEMQSDNPYILSMSLDSQRKLVI